MQPQRTVFFSTREIGHLRRPAPDALQALVAAAAHPPPDRAGDRRPAPVPAAAA